ncbi:glyoxalase [Flavobacterium sp.]|uniref:glyoxalase n=1 Tax=Flavobacterium sp. TaxID=239 RepID=UPI003BDF51E4
MKERDTKIIEIREETTGKISEGISGEELFQNNTLRPILKFQNDLLIELFIAYATKNKNVFFDLSIEKRISYIEKVSISDVVFRNQLIGVVVGLFSIVEYLEYSQNASNINKRIITMLIERLKSQLQLLEKK